MRKATSIIIALSLVATMFAGCGSNSANKANSTNKAVASNKKDAAEGEKNKEEQKIQEYRTDSSATKTLNPHIYTMSSEGKVIGRVSGALLQVVLNEKGDNYEFVPYHAEEMPTHSEDMKVWSFKLRDGLKWTDGTPINAETYEYSWKMLLDPKLKNTGADSVYKSLPIVNAKKYFMGECDWEEVGIKVKEGNVLELTLESPIPELIFLSNVYGGTGSSLSPVHKELYEAGMNEERTETNYGTSLETTASSGAYRLTQWIRDQYKEYEKNPEDVLADVYNADIIKERVVSSAATRLQLFENNEVDRASVSGANYDKYAEDPRLAFAKSKYVWGYYMNAHSETNPLLANKDFRHALYYGLDREKISKGIFKTFKPTGTIVSTVCLTADGENYRDTDLGKSMEEPNASYNPEKAKELFEKVYAENGNKKISVELTYFDGSESMKQMAEVSEEVFEGLFGADKFDLVLRAMPAQVAYDNYKTGKFELGVGATSQSTFDPWGSMIVYTSDYPNKNVPFTNEKFDELYKRTTTGDLALKVKEKNEALAEMEKILLDEMPLLPIFQNDNAYVFQDRVYLKTGGEFIPPVGFGEEQAEFVD